MDKKNDIEVLIQNKKYVISGFESGEYLQKVAAYLNQKYDSFKLENQYNRLDSEYRTVLVELNLADDYIKLKGEYGEALADNKKKQDNIFKMKHEMIALQTKQEELQKKLQMEKFAKSELEKKIVKLETELLERGLKQKNRE